MRVLVSVIVSCLFAFTSVSQVKAQYCPPRVSYRSPVSYPTYQAATTRVVSSYVTPTYSAPYVAPTYVASAYQAVHEAPYVAKKVVEYKKDDYYFLKFVAVVPLVELPTYSAQYVPPMAASHAAQNPQQGSHKAQQGSEEFKQILDLMKGFDSRLKALESGKQGVQQGPPPASAQNAQAAPQLPDIKVVNGQKCALCHERGKEAAGGDFVLSEKDGSIVQLSDALLGKLDDLCYEGKMPKINAKAKAAGITPLTDLEYASWRQEILRQRTLNKRKDS